VGHEDLLAVEVVASAAPLHDRRSSLSRSVRPCPYTNPTNVPGQYT
jgi:hypothetical protein